MQKRNYKNSNNTCEKRGKMELNRLLKNILNDLNNFLERIDDKVLDINPCPKCHEDRNVCPNDFYNKECNLCDQGSLCPNCHKEAYKIYTPYFDLVNAISANISNFTEKDIEEMLKKELKKINKRDTSQLY